MINYSVVLQIKNSKIVELIFFEFEMLGPQYQWTGLYTFKECFHISNLFEYFEEEELLPLESP